MKDKFKSIIPNKILPESTPDEPPAPVARITNETVAEHREEVLSSARKYIYPLQHSKHKIVLITTSLVVTTTIAFFSYCLVALYKFQSTSPFIYHVSQVIPFPIARTSNRFVSYESYLFELRHYIHYYESQQKVDFKDPKNQGQLEDFKKRALDTVISNAYVKKLAAENKVSVSDREVDDQITIVRNQNRLGVNDKVFEDVLKDFWGWSVADFKRSLREQMLAQKVVSILDTDTHKRAEAALTELKASNDFAAAAKKYSEDSATKDNGGDFGSPIDRTNRDLSAQTVDTLFKLQPGQYSDIVNTGYSLEILKNLETQGDKVRGAHIVFNFQDISKYVNDLKEKNKTQAYIRLK
jgi:hypothetical protein